LITPALELIEVFFPSFNLLILATLKLILHATTHE